MFYILFGEDDFSLRQKLGEIQRETVGEESPASNVSVLEAPQLTLNQLRNLCYTSPFLAEKRLVIVEGLLGLFEPRPSIKRGSAVAISETKLGEWQALSTCIKELPQTTVLVLVDGKVSKNNPLLKELSPLAKVMSFSFLRGKRLEGWIENQIKKGGGNISKQAVALLAELIGGDLWTLSNEINKLLLYTSGGTIEDSDVKQLVSQAREANVFALVDALLNRQTKLALQILHHLRKDGVSAAFLLVMVTRQIRLLILAKELSETHKPFQIQKKLGLTSEYVLDKTLKQTKGYSFEKLKQIYRKILETDLAIKTGKCSEELALDLLVRELCCV